MELKGNPSFVEDVNKLHVVKCVVVGDRGVGKSHLVCAKACGTKYTLRDLVQTHISTVWAVDHYRTNPKVIFYLHSQLTTRTTSLSLPISVLFL